MRDILYDHGIKNPLDQNEVMRAIAKHVTYCCRQRHPEVFEDDIPVFVKTAPNARRRTYPGDPDRIIVCSECHQPKRAEGNYYVRKDTATGWGLKCKLCVKKPGRPDGHVPSNKKNKEPCEEATSLSVTGG
jgi:hypothetical protein